MPQTLSPTQAVEFGRRAYFENTPVESLIHSDPVIQAIALAAYTLEEIRPIAEAGF